MGEHGKKKKKKKHSNIRFVTITAQHKSQNIWEESTQKRQANAQGGGVKKGRLQGGSSTLHTAPGGDVVSGEIEQSDQGVLWALSVTKNGKKRKRGTAKGGEGEKK